MEGNQMKMRETLLVVRDALATISAHEDDIEFVRAWIRQTKEAVQAALSLPRRNCDVGTAEEQVRRHCGMCVAITKNGTKGCDYSKCNSCFAKWALTPYEAKRGAKK